MYVPSSHLRRWPARSFAGGRLGVGAGFDQEPVLAPASHSRPRRVAGEGWIEVYTYAAMDPIPKPRRGAPDTATDILPGYYIIYVPIYIPYFVYVECAAAPHRTVPLLNSTPGTEERLGWTGNCLPR